MFLMDSDAATWPAELERLVEQLGSRTPVVHAKDVLIGADGITLPPVGRGGLDYGLLLRRLDRYQPQAPIIMEHLQPQEVADARASMERFLNRI